MSVISSVVSPSPIRSVFIATRWYQLSPRNTVLVLLPLLSLLGLIGTWGLARTNGLLVSILELISGEEAKLPPTGDPLLKTYTHIKVVDYQLSILVTFFTPLLNLSHGELTLFGIHGFGQLGAAWTLIMMEGMRMGNRPRPEDSTQLLSRLWSQLKRPNIVVIGLLCQTVSFAVTVPLWLIWHIVASPVAKSFPGAYASKILLVPLWDLRILPISVFLGYIMPSILMALPSPEYLSSSARQNYIAIWQFFPFWTSRIHWLLISLTRYILKKFFKNHANARPSTSEGTSYLSNVKHVYRFVLTLCMLTHIPVVIIALTPTFAFPVWAPTLALLGKQNIFRVFVPYFPFRDHQLSNQAEGVQTFLIWDLYIGGAAFLVWAIFLYRNATSEKAIVDTKTSLPIYGELLRGNDPQTPRDVDLWRILLGKIAVWTLVSGPMGALTILLWERDAIVRQKIKQGL
ncbi:Citreoviridin biosynthesis protein D [Lachnellula suecica]|uniref:Citreoviridin biosynthesis protein D n=1 Tax=Lachnellula suecica TaxID=602035 RepID=A0A8T9CDD0_9HELO|nr:Citreoviridin biosynthesis protein D [Lachnellula suecica]